MSCYPVGSDLWGGDVEGSLLLAQGETDWQRLVFTSQPQEVAHRYYTLSFTAKHADEGEAVFYLDGIQVSPGEEPSAEEAFPCRTSVAGTLATPVLANIFKRGKDAPSSRSSSPIRLQRAGRRRPRYRSMICSTAKSLSRPLRSQLEPFQRHSAACVLPELAFGSYRAALPPTPKMALCSMRCPSRSCRISVGSIASGCTPSWTSTVWMWPRVSGRGGIASGTAQP